jgi:hypothetical protein
VAKRIASKRGANSSSKGQLMKTERAKSICKVDGRRGQPLKASAALRMYESRSLC